MPWVGFVSTISASERAKTAHTLDRSATVSGGECSTHGKKIIAGKFLDGKKPKERNHYENLGV
jgi:hypothetical protein